MLSLRSDSAGGEKESLVGFSIQSSILYEVGGLSSNISNIRAVSL
jgi:hypothetical protein